MRFTRAFMMFGLAVGIALAAWAFVAAFQTGNPASAGSGDRLIGLWRGVQPSDGAIATLSVRDMDRNGVYETTYHEPWFSTCDGERGIVNGEIVPQGDKTYEYSRTLECPTNGNVVDVTSSVTYFPADDLLLIGVEDVMHRISTR